MIDITDWTLMWVRNNGFPRARRVFQSARAPQIPILLSPAEARDTRGQPVTYLLHMAGGTKLFVRWRSVMSVRHAA